MNNFEIDYSKEIEKLIEAYEKSGGKKEEILSPQFASLILNGHKVLNVNNIKGIELKVIESTEEYIKLKIIVEDNIKFKFPVHLCMGHTKPEGTQRIFSNYEIGDNVEIEFITHCAFPDAKNLSHIMSSEIYIGKHSKMTYSETHYHGEKYGVLTEPRTKAYLKEGAIFYNLFKLTKGRVGKLDIIYEAYLEKNAVTELNTKVYGKKNDDIKINEIIHLNGEYSKGIAKSRVFLIENSKSEFIGKTYGNGNFSRGHIDCTEIIKDNAKAYATPIVAVTNNTSKVTHEAAIGSVDKKQVETLMSKGLSEDEAIDIIVKGILK